MLVAMNAWGATPLHMATKGGHLDAMDAILAHSASISDKHAACAYVSLGDASGHTPLHLAAASGCVAAVSRLLTAGAETNALSSSQHTPLRSAVRDDQLDVVLLLLGAGASLHSLSSLCWSSDDLTSRVKLAVQEFVRRKSVLCAACFSANVSGKRIAGCGSGMLLPCLPVEVQELVLSRVFGVDVCFYSMLLTLNIEAGRSCCM